MDNVWNARGLLIQNDGYRKWQQHPEASDEGTPVVGWTSSLSQGQTFDIHEPCNLTRQMICCTELSERLYVETILKRARTFKNYLAGDWMTHLSIIVYNHLTFQGIWIYDASPLVVWTQVHDLKPDKMDSRVILWYRDLANPAASQCNGLCGPANIQFVKISSHEAVGLQGAITQSDSSNTLTYITLLTQIYSSMAHKLFCGLPKDPKILCCSCVFKCSQ